MCRCRDPVREGEASAVNTMAIVVGHVSYVPVLTRAPCQSAKDCSVEQLQTALLQSGGHKTLNRHKQGGLF